MKKYFALIGELLVMSVLLLTSCKSNEEKATELIKKELSKTLYDFDSYQPIETVVREAKETAYNDSACWNTAGTLTVGVERFIDYLKDAKSTSAYVSIWGRPSHHSSSFSDQQYFKYKKEMDDAIAKANKAARICNEIADTLSGMVKTLDTNKIIGWEVNHSFRCKTRGGRPEIAHFRFVMDKDFSRIIIIEDTENKTYQGVHEIIEKILVGWDNLDTIDLN